MMLGYVEQYVCYGLYLSSDTTLATIVSWPFVINNVIHIDNIFPSDWVVSS